MKSYHHRFVSLTTAVICLLTLLAATLTARAQLVTNTFSSPSLDLVTNGVIGSGFDGADLAFGDVPNANNAGIGNGMTLAANSGASIGAPGSGFLVVQTINSAWGQGGPGDDGFFAFNIVKGDFTVSVDVAPTYNDLAYVFSGLMARAVSDGTGGAYDPSGTNASENWVSITLFEEFGIPTMSEDMTNGTSDQIANNGSGSLYGATTASATRFIFTIARLTAGRGRLNRQLHGRICTAPRCRLASRRVLTPATRRSYSSQITVCLARTLLGPRQTIPRTS
jgi:hypothetical protein